MLTLMILDVIAQDVMASDNSQDNCGSITYDCKEHYPI